MVVLIVAVIAALGSIAAAIISARSAGQTQQNATEAARLIELEKRLGVVRAQNFEPFFKAINVFFDAAAGEGNEPDASQVQALLDEIVTFMTWSQMYASDETVRAFMRFRQGAFADVPNMVGLRLVAELLLQLRRDLGEPKTTIQALDLLALRSGDAFANDEMYAVLTDPLPVIYERYKWTPPWEFSKQVADPESEAGDGLANHRPTG